MPVECDDFHDSCVFPERNCGRARCWRKLVLPDVIGNDDSKRRVIETASPWDFRGDKVDKQRYNDGRVKPREKINVLKKRAGVA